MHICSLMVIDHSCSESGSRYNGHLGNPQSELSLLLTTQGGPTSLGKHESHWTIGGLDITWKSSYYPLSKGGKSQCVSLQLAQKQIVKPLWAEATTRFSVLDPEGVSLRQVQHELYSVWAGSGSHSGQNCTGFSLHTRADEKSKHYSTLYFYAKIKCKIYF